MAARAIGSVLFVVGGLAACSGIPGQRPVIARYWMTATPLPMGGISTPLCVGIDAIEPGGVWWWEPGRLGCLNRSTGPILFPAWEPVVTPSPGGTGFSVRFQIGLHAPVNSPGPDVAEVALWWAGDSVTALPAGARVAILRRANLDIPGP